MDGPSCSRADIAERLRAGESPSAIARDCGVSRQYVHQAGQRPPASGVRQVVDDERGPGIDEAFNDAIKAAAIERMDQHDMLPEVIADLGFVPCRAEWCSKERVHKEHRRSGCP